jgi:hypothetical protein
MKEKHRQVKWKHAFPEFYLLTIPSLNSVHSLFPSKNIWIILHVPRAHSLSKCYDFFMHSSNITTVFFHLPLTVIFMSVKCRLFDLSKCLLALSRSQQELTNMSLLVSPFPFILLHLPRRKNSRNKQTDINEDRYFRWYTAVSRHVPTWIEARRN